MKSNTLLVALSVATVGITSARASDAVLMRHLQARVAGFAQAVNRNDLAAVKKHIPETAKFQLSPHHLMTAEEFIKTVAQTEKTVKNLKVVMTLKSAQATSGGAWGNLVVVTTGRHQDSKGRWHRIESRERAVASWKKTGAGYELERITQTAFSARVDGRPVASADRT